MAAPCCCCGHVPNSPQRPIPLNERIQRAIHVLQDGRLSLFTAFLRVLDPMQEDFATYRGHIYACSKDQPHGKLAQLLDCLFQDSRSKAQLLAWMEPHALRLVARKVYNEMDDVKHILSGTIDTISPELLLTWDINSMVGKIMEERAPVLSEILKSAAQSDRASRENSVKDISTTCQVIVTQLAKARSNRALYFAAPFALFLWTNGASRQTIEALAKCGLSISFTSLLKLLNKLASRCLDQAAQITRFPHILCYNNINISTSIFVEQRIGAPAKVQSGTFPIVYELSNTNPQHLCLGPMLQHANQATDLTFNGDVRPTNDQVRAFYGQLRIHIIAVLLDVCTSFNGPLGYQDHSDPLLEHEERHKPPKGYKTKQFPLRTSTIDESSISGNIAVINDVYINQVKMTHEQLLDRAIPSINDQSTNARIRGAKVLRAKDVNTFTQLKCLQLGFGLFHLCMNLIWALLHVHRGSISEPGSLSYFFALLDRSRLGSEHPDYHTLLSTLMQILDGIVLNAWKAECGHSSLSTLAASNPTPTELCNIADKILHNHVTPPHDLPKGKNNDPRSTKVPDHSGQRSLRDEATVDVAQRNLQILTCDLLVVREVICATSDGAGSNNYCAEILHFIYNLKRVWTPEFANIMRDSMLINTTGLEGHFMAIDLNIEHHICFLKANSYIIRVLCDVNMLLQRFYASKGVYASWDHLGDISAAVDLLRHVQKQVGKSLDISYQGITHITPDTSASVNKVAHKVSELKLHTFLPHREENSRIRLVVNSLALGEQKLKSATLATFNRKVRAMMAGEGEGLEDEEDEIPKENFDRSSDESQ
ncbi:hypothetical protein EV363DRAFT_1583268 [Boletus edulis]|nr:hypothetical protein EV363DRAFT_1583268 [Boletus edulis]